MPGIFGDASDFYRLAGDFTQISAKTVPAMRGVIDEAGQAFEKEWAANARETAGEHGKHYPDSIGHEMAFTVSSIAVDVGPGVGAGFGKKQSKMSFEFGSENQPPHLDGLRALDGIAPQLDRMIDSAMGHLFG